MTDQKYPDDKIFDALALMLSFAAKELGNVKVTIDSCGWTWPHLTKKEKAFVREILLLDENNNPISPDQCGAMTGFRPSFAALKYDDGRPDYSDMVWTLSKIIRVYKRSKRPWWKHPKYHFWHWKLTILPVLYFKRWAFSRCRTCGGRFKLGESPLSHSCDSSGPGWFRNAENCSHIKCADAQPVGAKE